MKPDDLEAMLTARGAIRRGHFSLSSGLHSDVYVQKFRVLEHPEDARRLGVAVAGLFDSSFDVVASPAVGALLLGFTTALAANVRFIFAERVDGLMRFRRGFKLEPHERVLVVEDVVTTGGSAAEVAALVGAAGAQLEGVGALIDRIRRPMGELGLGAPFRALLRVDADAWPPDACPLCDSGESLEDPGSRPRGKRPD